MWAAIADAKDAAARAASEGAAAVAAARAAAELQAAALQEQASKAAEAAAEQASKAAGAAAEHAKKIDLSSIQEAVLFPGEEDTPSWETPARPAQKLQRKQQSARAGSSSAAPLSVPRPSFPPAGEAPTPVASIGNILSAAPTPLPPPSGQAGTPRAATGREGGEGGGGGEAGSSTAASRGAAQKEAASRLRAAEARLRQLEAEALCLRTAIIGCLPGPASGQESHPSDELCRRLGEAYEEARRGGEGGEGGGLESDFLRAQVLGTLA